MELRLAQGCRLRMGCRLPWLEEGMGPYKHRQEESCRHRATRDILWVMGSL